MARLVTDYINNTAKKYPDKAAFADDVRSITFSEVLTEAKHVAMELINVDVCKKPVAIYMDKCVECVPAFLGAVFSGNFYTPLDSNMPVARIDKIMNTLMPAAIVTDEAHKEAVKEFCGECKIIIYEDAVKNSIDEEKIMSVESKVLDTDVLYILFTSGSTGTPKGVIISERAAMDYIEWGAERFNIDDTFVIGNQTPFYFSMSVFDIYQTLYTGATTYIVPKKLFSFPGMLMQYLFDRSINTLFWVPSALTMVAALGALNTPHLPELKNVFFGGEVMPVKQLNKWIKAYPDVRYVNFYGPTEVADTCTIYEVDREFDNTAQLPMGFPCKNSDVFLLDDNNNLVTGENVGEVCVRGCGLAYGYYNAPDKTQEVFVQNPLNPYYPEKIYRTGDLAQYNEYGELVYISRKDFQIKHMGQRIELGEIETAVSSVDGVDSNCCLYDTKKSKIVLFYAGSIDEHGLMEQLKELVPAYMMPNKRVHLEEMPFNLNGKVDRQKLKEMM